MARARAMARARPMGWTRDRPSLRARAIVSSRARARAGSVFKRPDRFCWRTKFNVTVPFVCVCVSVRSFLLPRASRP